MRTIALWTAVAVTAAYGVAVIASGVKEMTQKPMRLQAWAVGLWTAAGVALLASASLIGSSAPSAVWLLALSLVVVHLLAFNNGVRLHGSIKPSHHLVRGLLSAALIVLAWVGMT